MNTYDLFLTNPCVWRIIDVGSLSGEKLKVAERPLLATRDENPFIIPIFFLFYIIVATSNSFE
jgi:hypothetical protein